MKISHVVCHVLRAEIKNAFYYSQGFYASRDAVLLEIRTNEGVSGWGHAFGRPELLPAEVELQYAPLLMGQDATEWGALWQRLGGLRGGHFGIIGGLEMALLDVAGKACARPVHHLLGGALRDRVKVYATGLYRLQRWQDTNAWREGLVAEALGYRDEGFAATKMKIGFVPSEDVGLVHAVRDAIGDDMGLAVDANGAWAAAEAIAVGRQLESANLLWYEEPLPITDLDGYEEVRRAVAIPVAGGEGVAGLQGFRDVISRRAVDIIQPDITVAGGFSMMQRVQALADAHHIRVLPHSWGTAVSLAATLHFLATVPDVPPSVTPIEPLLEYDRSENPLRDDLLVANLRQKGGYLKVPQGPGLGIELDEEQLDRYRLASLTTKAQLIFGTGV